MRRGRQLIAGCRVDRAATFVKKSVMRSTQADQVLELGLATFRPVLYVMPIDDDVATTREAASSVASRLWFNGKTKYVGLFDADKKEVS